MNKPKFYPPALFNAAAIILVIFHFVFPINNIISGYWKLIGIIPLFAGVSLNLIADKAFKMNMTTVKPGEESNVLITHGIFKFSRNPMYLGMILIQISIAIFLGSLSPYFVIIIFVYLLDKIFIIDEEKMLYDKFDSRWNEYIRTTRKWI